MTKEYKHSQLFTLGGLIIGIGLTPACGGVSTKVSNVAEFVYVATGSSIAQFSVDSHGQLSPLSPATVVTTPSATNNVWVAASKDAKYAYTADKAQGTVSQYSISGTGALVPLNPPTVPSGNKPVSVVITPDTKFVYSLNQNDNKIKQFSVGADGTLTALVPATINTDTNGQTMVISPDGKFLYATCFASGVIDAYSIATNGQLTALTVPSYSVTFAIGAAISPDGKYLYCPSASDTAQFSISASGALTPLSPSTVAGTGVGNSSFAVTPDGKHGYLGVFNGGIPGSPVDQYSIGATGKLTALAPTSVAAGNAPQWILAELSGNYLYVANQNDGTVSEFQIAADGTLSAESPAFVTLTGALNMSVTAR